MRSDTYIQNSNKYYLFHKDKRHNINDCYAFRKTNCYGISLVIHKKRNSYPNIKRKSLMHHKISYKVAFPSL